MKRKRLKIGDIFEIPLSDGQKAYGQYVLADKENGPMIRVFDLITKHSIGVDEITRCSNMFPPIIVGLKAAIKTGQWIIVGSSSVKDFDSPDFISAMYDGVNDKMGMWYLWDGSESKYVSLGYILPEKYRELEQLIVWSPDNLKKRIETGINPIDRWLDL